jgi:hypothetical protein
MSCCRRSAFSVSSSARERVRSAMNPLATPEGRHAAELPHRPRRQIGDRDRKPGDGGAEHGAIGADPRTIIKACSNENPERSCGGGGE